MASAIIPLGLSILSSCLQFLCPSSLGTHGTRAPTNEPRTISPSRHRASFWRHNHCVQCAHPDLGPGSHMARYNSNLERCSILETRSPRPEGTKRPFLSRNIYDLHLRCRVMFLRISLHTNTQPSNFTSRRHDTTIILFSMRPILLSERAITWAKRRRGAHATCRCPHFVSVSLACEVGNEGRLYRAAGLWCTSALGLIFFSLVSCCESGWLMSVVDADKGSLPRIGAG